VNLYGVTIQRGLSVLGFDPGPIDGIIGDRTLAAFDALVDHLGLTESVIALSEDRRTAEITPSSLGNKIQLAAARFDLNADRVESASTLPAPRPGSDSSSAITPAGFWRSANPWAWGAALVPLALLFGGLGFFLTRKG
jgi:lysozyme family protein